MQNFPIHICLCLYIHTAHHETFCKTGNRSQNDIVAGWCKITVISTETLTEIHIMSQKKIPSLQSSSMYWSETWHLHALAELFVAGCATEPVSENLPQHMYTALSPEKSPPPPPAFQKDHPSRLAQQLHLPCTLSHYERNSDLNAAPSECSYGLKCS